uniref:Uncharacterized protein n=1 Tax=Timema douglasi TaxID=61478 RepID=A0A7R8VLC6_TIMDO|nr:unnamed protein product [Timema douglasi]
MNVVLDEKRGFMVHAESISTRTLKEMNKIISIGQERFRLSMLLILGYGSSAWAQKFRKVRMKRKIRSLQRSILLRPFGAYRTVATDALSIVLGIWPLDLEIGSRAAMYWSRKGKLDRGGVNGRQVRRFLLNEWQEDWDGSVTGRRTYQLSPNSSPLLVHYIIDHGPYWVDLFLRRLTDSRQYTAPGGSYIPPTERCGQVEPVGYDADKVSKRKRDKYITELKHRRQVRQMGQTETEQKEETEDESDATEDIVQTADEPGGAKLPAEKRSEVTSVEKGDIALSLTPHRWSRMGTIEILGWSCQASGPISCGIRSRWSAIFNRALPKVADRGMPASHWGSHRSGGLLDPEEGETHSGEGVPGAADLSPSCLGGYSVLEATWVRTPDHQYLYRRTTVEPRVPGFINRVVSPRVSVGKAELCHEREKPIRAQLRSFKAFRRHHQQSYKQD